MIKELWINLPVKDINKSKEFFKKLGFSFNQEHGNSDSSACLLVGEKNTVVMLFEEQTFKSFISNEITYTNKSTEVLFSIGMNSKEEVDIMAKNAVDAGGKSSHEPTEMQGWMYGCIFTDLDGHSWNVMYMDMSKFEN